MALLAANEGVPGVAAPARFGYLDGDAPVAQLDRALPSEGRGHKFDSCRVRQSPDNRLVQMSQLVGVSHHIDCRDFSVIDFECGRLEFTVRF